MEEASLLMVCTLSFAVVLVVLSLVAAIMRALIWVFPEQVKKKMDAPTLAAITAAVSAHYPGGQITEVKERE